MRVVDGLDPLLVAAFVMEGQPGPRGVTGEETLTISNIRSDVKPSSLLPPSFLALVASLITLRGHEGLGPMKILVLGSGGVGSAFAPIAARRDFYEHVVFADIDERRALRVVDRFGSNGRFSAAKVDASDAADVAAVAKAKGCDAILNAADPRF